MLRSTICKKLEECKLFADEVEKTLSNLKKKYKEEEIIDKTKRLKRVIEHLEILNELFNHQNEIEKKKTSQNVLTDEDIQR